MSLIAVRALWGDIEMITHAKALADVKACLARQSDLGIPLRVYCFGQKNLQFLERAGCEATILETSPVVDWNRTRAREPEDQGRINYGLSQWRHKLEAVMAALNAPAAGKTGVIWLDWDTVVNRPVDGVLTRSLAMGPPFQGRLRQYHTAHAPWRPAEFGQRRVYHGGCFYVREPAIIQKAIGVQAKRYPHMPDETALSWYVDRKMLDGPQQPAAHREAGIDNPWLYSTKDNVVASTLKSYFSEGIVKHVGKPKKVR